MSTSIIVVLISQYIQLSNHYVLPETNYVTCQLLLNLKEINVQTDGILNKWELNVFLKDEDLELITMKFGGPDKLVGEHLMGIGLRENGKIRF